MVKANRRAKKTFPRIKKLADAFKEDYSKELLKIDNFLGMCSFHKDQLSVTAVVGQVPPAPSEKTDS